MPARAGDALSSSFRVFETESFRRDLERLPAGISDRLGAKLRELVYPVLRVRPHFGPNIRKLRDWRPPTRRYRLGAWRVFYQMDDRERVVFLVALHPRREAYRASRP